MFVMKTLLSSYSKTIASILASAVILSIGAVCYIYRQPDITVIGPVMAADGLGKNTIDFVQLLSKKYYVNLLPTNLNKKHLPDKIKKILLNPNKRMGKIILFTKPVWNPEDRTKINYKKIRNAKNSIKVAYSMFESSLIPNEWVVELNTSFDAVVVPDEYLVSVYKRSGVRVPIEVLPICLDLHGLDKYKLREKKDDSFVFGIMSSGIYRKNILQVAKVFNKLFGDKKNVFLRINTRYSLDGTNSNLKSFISKNKITNIIVSEVCLSPNQYYSFLSGLDCLINASLGEGFSIQPREAMYLGIPCIVTDNTAQSTICKTGLVASVSCEMTEPAFHYFSKIPYGLYFKCTDEDLSSTMVDVFQNHTKYLSKRESMIRWAKQFDTKEMQSTYEAFFDYERLKEAINQK